MRRTAALRLTVTAAVVGALGVVAVAVAVARSGGGHDRVRPVDQDAITRLATEPAPSTAAPTAAPTPAPTRAPTAGTTPSTRRPSTAARPPATQSQTQPPAAGSAAPAQPVRVVIGSVSVNAPVVPVGVARDGEVQIPARISTVGWYRYAAEPGDGQGSTVLVGHVDSAADGEGAFFRLRDVGRGNLVRVTTGSGRTLVYRVVSRAQFPKPSVPLDDLFAVTGAPRLTLITCGGSFDATRRSYRDNVVVTAVPNA